MQVHEYQHQLVSLNVGRNRIARAVLALLAFTAGCKDAPTAERSGAQQAVRMAVQGNVVAAPGAVLEALVTYSTGSPARTVTLAHDSLQISTAASNTSLSIAADVGPCVREAEAASAGCTVDLTVRLKRDGRVLDESVQHYPVTSTTQQIDVPSVQLYEVATVRIDPAAVTAFEPGDTKVFTAAALDRTGAAVVGRSAAWQVVSGSVIISATGEVRAVAPGAARIRATIGERTGELLFDVGAPTVATIDLAPNDTLIPVGGRVTYRAVARALNGDVLVGRAITLSSSTSAATVAGNVATGVAVGQTTITARSTEGRAGATVSATAVLRVQAAPPILVDRALVVFDTLGPNALSPVAPVAITSSAPPPSTD